MVAAIPASNRTSAAGAFSADRDGTCRRCHQRPGWRKAPVAMGADELVKKPTEMMTAAIEESKEQ